MRIVFLFLSLLFVPAVAFAQKPAKKPPTCVGLPKVKDKSWNHARSKLLSRISTKRHVARDVVAQPKTKATAEAKFAYGSISKDLQDERIDVFLTDCKTTKRIGSAVTNKDGWVAIPLTTPKTPGMYELVFRVAGDSTTARASVFVADKKTKFVVFDIDGTLTTSDKEIVTDVGRDYFKRVENGAYDPKMYPYAVQLVAQYVKKGYTPVYVSGRPYWLMDQTRHWLKNHKFPRGPVIITRRNRDSLPKKKGVGAFKLSVLTALQKTAPIQFAHGNADTDVYAYIEAGIPSDRVYIIGPNAGKRGTHAVKKSWKLRTEELQLP